VRNGKQMNDNDIVYQVPTVERGDATSNEIGACIGIYGHEASLVYIFIYWFQKKKYMYMRSIKRE